MLSRERSHYSQYSPAPPPPPQSAIVEVASTSSLNVSWTAPSNTCNVGRYQLLVSGEDCGCESMNVSVSTTSVSCSGWTARGQNCSFEVSTVSQDCGFTSDPVNEYVVLMGKHKHQTDVLCMCMLQFVVPPAPTQLLVIFSAYQITVEFMQPVSKDGEVCMHSLFQTDCYSSWYQPQLYYNLRCDGGWN